MEHDDKTVQSEV